MQTMSHRFSVTDKYESYDFLTQKTLTKFVVVFPRLSLKVNKMRPEANVRLMKAFFRISEFRSIGNLKANRHDPNCNLMVEDVSVNVMWTNDGRRNSKQQTCIL